MKKLFAIAFALALTAHLVTAQAGNTGTDKTSKPAAKHKTKRTPPAAEKPATTQDKVSLNPQPLPPKVQSKTVNPSDKVALNPQPLPPKEGHKTVNPSDKVALNPQPLPPKPQPNTAAKKKTTSQPTGKKIDKADTK